MTTDARRAGLSADGGPGAAPSSRQAASGAGWDAPPLDLRAMLPQALRDAPPFRWLRLRVLTGPRRNDPLARRLGDPSHERRQAWLRQRYGDATPALVVDRSELAQPRFVVMGDTGEGDLSQYAPAALLGTVGRDTDFLVVCSDVIYPAGGVLEYAYKFCWPYRDYPGPVYALPGNHDWYDSLRGFMAYFCGQPAEPPRERRPLLSRDGLRDRLWLDLAEPPDPVKSDLIATLRQEPGQRATLPGPYYVVRTGPVDLVAIDTGIDGSIDAAQGAWLREVSRTDRPKVLLTGKPIYVDGQHHPCPIDGGRGGTVDDVVRDPACHYVAAIGGDVHNYQRYPVDVGGGRVVQYIVSGGGGAYLHPTHKIPSLDGAGIPGVREADFRCYPLRGDSLAAYSRVYDAKLPGSWRLTPAEAAAYLAQRLGQPTTRPDDGTVVDDRVRRRGDRVFPLPGSFRGPWHLVFAELFDWDDPPLFKHLLRVEADARRLEITCYPATGCVVPGDLPTPEDRVRCDLGSGAWEVLAA